MKSQILAASLFLVSSSSLGVAADIPDPAIEYNAEDINAWGGFYAGIHAGWTWVTAKDNLGNPSVDFDGGTIGAFAGYNHSVDRFVVGAEIDVSYHNQSKYVRTVKIEGGWSSGLSARLGYAFDAFLPYARIGVGLQEGYQRGLVSGREDTSIHTYLEGGLGLETKVFDNLSLRGEVLYRQASSETYRLSGPFKGDFDSTALRIGLSHQF